MSFKTMKVFDSNRPVRMPQDVFNASSILSGDLHGNGNDSYYPFKIVENPTGKGEGASYLSDDEIKILTDWLIEQGAVVGETILVYNWW